MAELRKNKFKEALINFQFQRGLWVTMSDPLAVEMMASCGFDWMLFDTEHSPMDAISVLPLLQMMAAYPDTSPIVRPGSLNLPEIKKILDLGAQNILIPMINTADDAELAVASVTYPPAGQRGVSGLTRATNFATIPGYHKKAREEIALLIQVETLQAMNELENMAAVPGVDGIFVGPADLAAGLGYAGEPTHPEVQGAVIDCIKRIRAAGKPAGFLSADLAFVEKAIDAGAVFVANDIDLAALRRGLRVPK